MEYKDNREEIRLERASDIQRLQIFTEIGRRAFEKTALLENKDWDNTDETAVDSYLLQIAPFVHPKIEPSFWQHLIFTSVYAEMLAEKTGIMNPTEARIVAKLHDIGTAINPTFLRKEYLGASLLKVIGIKNEVIKSFPPVPRIYGVGGSIKSTEDMTPKQNLVNVADNLGKMGPNGLFTKKAFIENAKGQPSRYPPSIWPSSQVGYTRLTEKNKQDHAVQLVLDEIQWLEEKYKINFDELKNSVQAEFENPERQKFLTSLINAQKTS